MSMSGFTPTKQFLLIFLVLNVVFWWSVSAFFLEIKKVNRSISLLENTIEVELEREKVLESVKNVILDTAAERSKLDTYFVSSKNAVDFITLLEELARGSTVKLSISSFKEEKAKPGDINGLIEISLKAEGEWRNILNFMSLLETLPYKSDLTETIFGVNFITAAGSKESARSVWNGSLQLSLLTLD